MQIQQNNAQNKPTFGTAFIRFNQKELYKLPKETQKKVVSILTKDVHYVENAMFQAYLGSSDDSQKLVATSLFTNNTSFKFTNSPKKEEQMVRIFKRLFGDNNLDTKVIKNTPENAAKLSSENAATDTWTLIGK